MRFARLRRVTTGMVALGFTLSVAAGCGSSSNAKSTNGLEKSTILVGQMPVIDDASLKVAIDKGFFKAEGLTVKTQIIKGGADSIPALKSGRMDFSFGNYVSYFLAEASHAIDLRVVSDAYAIGPGTHVILVPKNSPIHSPKDLAGKKIGVNTKKNLSTILLHAGMKPYGVDLDEAKNSTELAFPEMENALKSGVVQAAQTVEPFSTQIQKSIGARPVLDLSQGPTADFPAGGYVVTESFLKKNPKTVAAFQRAIAKAQAALADRKVLQQVIPTYTNIPTSTVPSLHYGTYPTSISATRLQRVADVMQQFGYLSAPLDVKQLIAQVPAGK
jgi:NitT/TauT family transport system substrate-binding protein